MVLRKFLVNKFTKKSHSNIDKGSTIHNNFDIDQVVNLLTGIGAIDYDLANISRGISNYYLTNPVNHRIHSKKIFLT
jgi:hypothetical protein